MRPDVFERKGRDGRGRCVDARRSRGYDTIAPPCSGGARPSNRKAGSWHSRQRRRTMPHPAFPLRSLRSTSAAHAAHAGAGHEQPQNLFTPFTLFTLFTVHPPPHTPHAPGRGTSTPKLFTPFTLFTLFTVQPTPHAPGPEPPEPPFFPQFKTKNLVFIGLFANSSANHHKFAGVLFPPRVSAILNDMKRMVQSVPALCGPRWINAK